MPRRSGGCSRRDADTGPDAARAEEAVGERTVRTAPAGGTPTIIADRCDVANASYDRTRVIRAHTDEGAPVALLLALDPPDGTALARAADGHLVAIDLYEQTTRQRAAYRPGFCDLMPQAPDEARWHSWRIFDVIPLSDVDRLEQIRVGYPAEGVRLECDRVAY